MNCPNCGNEINENQKFCPNCGAKINSKNHNIKWVYIAGGLICLVIIALFLATFLNSKNKVLALQPCNVLNNKFANYEITENTTEEENSAYLVYIDKCKLPDLMKQQKIEEFNQQMTYLHSALDPEFCSDVSEEEAKKNIENMINNNPAYKDVSTALSRLYMWDIVDLFNQCADDMWRYRDINEIISKADEITVEDLEDLVDMLYESADYGLKNKNPWCVDDFVDNLIKLTPYIAKNQNIKTKWLNLFEKIKNDVSGMTEHNIVNPVIPTIEEYINTHK